MEVGVETDGKVVTVGLDEILRLTGYGPTACLLDLVEIKECENEFVAIGLYQVKEGKNPIIDDHFPGDIVLSKNNAGEMIEQVGYVLLAWMGRVKPKRIRARETRDLKMLREVRDGDTVIITLNVPRDIRSRRIGEGPTVVEIYQEFKGSMYLIDELTGEACHDPVAIGSFKGIVLVDQ